MNPSQNNPANLSGYLLCAMPRLQEPQFQRTVVLVIEHQESGTFGLILNRPLDTTAEEIFNGLGIQWEGSSEELAYQGGPVESTRGFVLHTAEDWDPDAVKVQPGLWLTSSLDGVLDELRPGVGGPDMPLRLFLGYVGWSSGQLATEIATGSWVIIPVEPLLQELSQRLPAHEQAHEQTPESQPWAALLRSSPKALWDEALHSIGIDPGRLVSASGRTITLH